MLTIRTACLEDEQAVVALWRRCGLVVSYNDPVADFQFAVRSECSDVLIGVDASGDIKSSLMVGHDGHRGWIYYVGSDPDSRGVGLGRDITRAAEDWLRRRSIAKMQLLVRESNSKVVSFYERLGFETVPTVVMAKWL